MQVNLHEVKTHLSRYVDQVLAVEEVLLAGEPGPRRGGCLRDKATSRSNRRRQPQTACREPSAGCYSAW
jgi:antitoxin (DNA-binding transcriptional repressor) of toxin-antitoxin stability system